MPRSDALYDGAAEWIEAVSKSSAVRVSGPTVKSRGTAKLGMMSVRLGGGEDGEDGRQRDDA